MQHNLDWVQQDLYIENMVQTKVDRKIEVNDILSYFLDDGVGPILKWMKLTMRSYDLLLLNLAKPNHQPTRCEVFIIAQVILSISVLKNGLHLLLETQETLKRTVL